MHKHIYLLALMKNLIKFQKENLGKNLLKAQTWRKQLSNPNQTYKCMPRVEMSLPNLFLTKEEEEELLYKL